jgi:hypothetical protein
MKKIYLVLAVMIITISSCKKDYTCTCSDSTGVVSTFTIKDKKGKATEQCNSYYNSNYGNIPFNTTTCELK